MELLFLWARGQEFVLGRFFLARQAFGWLCIRAQASKQLRQHRGLPGRTLGFPTLVIPALRKRRPVEPVHKLDSLASGEVGH